MHEAGTFSTAKKLSETVKAGEVCEIFQRDPIKLLITIFKITRTAVINYHVFL